MSLVVSQGAGFARQRSGHLLLASVMAVVALGAAAQSSRAADSDAPPGAPDTWLPAEAWVMRAWTPFSEARLYKLIGSNRNQMRAWLKDDRRTIAQLAGTHGVPLDGLAARLVGKRRRGVSRRQHRELRSRTRRVLTQGHLAQHLFFHTFHNEVLISRTWPIFGVAPTDWHSNREQYSPRDIGFRHGRPEHRMHTKVVGALLHSTLDGMRRGWMPRAQARRQLSTQRKLVGAWLCSPPIAPGAEPT